MLAINTSANYTSDCGTGERVEKAGRAGRASRTSKDVGRVGQVRRVGQGENFEF